MTPQQISIIKSLREAGYALTIFSPDELLGVNPKDVEGRLAELGNKVIEDLEPTVNVINPDADGLTEHGMEIEINHDENRQLLGIFDPKTGQFVEPDLIDVKKLEGAVISRAVVSYPIDPTTARNGNGLEFSTGMPIAIRDEIAAMGMQCSSDFAVHHVDSSGGQGDPEIGICYSAKVNQSPFIDVELGLQVEKPSWYEECHSWIGIGTAGNHDIWMSRSCEDASARNIYQVTPEGEGAPTGKSGHPILRNLLELKGITGDVVPNVFYPPPGWICASNYTKHFMDGALFEMVMGDMEKGQALYWMTIAKRNNRSFVPVHGGVEMAPCKSVSEAALALKSYWDCLPLSHKMLDRPERERQSA